MLLRPADLSCNSSRLVSPENKPDGRTGSRKSASMMIVPILVRPAKLVEVSGPIIPLFTSNFFKDVKLESILLEIPEDKTDTIKFVNLVNRYSA